MYKYHKFAKYNNMKTICKNNYFILIPIIILNIISLLYLFKTPYFTKQFIYIILSLIFLLIASKINYKFIHKYSKHFYLISIILGGSFYLLDITYEEGNLLVFRNNYLINFIVLVLGSIFIIFLFNQVK